MSKKKKRVVQFRREIARRVILALRRIAHTLSEPFGKMWVRADGMIHHMGNFVEPLLLAKKYKVSV